MIDMTYWCESCARKNNCYTIRSRPKCFTPITSNDRTADRKSEPTCSKMEQVEDEPQTDCAWK